MFITINITLYSILFSFFIVLTLFTLTFPFAFKALPSIDIKNYTYPFSSFAFLRIVNISKFLFIAIL